LVVKDVFFGHFESVVGRVLEAPFGLLDDLEEVRGDFLWSLYGKEETGVLKVNGKLYFERGVSEILHDKGPCVVFHFLFGLKLFSRHPHTDHGRRVLIEFRVKFIDQQKPSFFGGGVGQAQIAVIVLVLEGQDFFVDFVGGEFGRDQFYGLDQKLGIGVVHDSVDQEGVVGHGFIDEEEAEVFVEDFLDRVQGGKGIVGLGFFLVDDFLQFFLRTPFQLNCQSFSELLVVAFFLDDESHAEGVFCLLPDSDVLFIVLGKVHDFLHFVLEFEILISCDQSISGFSALGDILAQFVYDFLDEGELDFGHFGDKFEFPVLRRLDANIFQGLESQVDTD
jgi:hypothetical protein